MEKLLEFFTPENYTLYLEIDRHAGIIKGRAKILGIPHRETIFLHADNHTIKSVTVTSPINDIGYGVDEPVVYTYKDNLLKINLLEETAPRPGKLPGDYSPVDHRTLISIEYEAPLSHDMQGCYVSTYEHEGKTRYIAATQFESHYARRCFPCIDEPAAKATFDLCLNIADYEPDDVVLANTEVEKELRDTTRHEFTFETTPRMSTYLLAWVVGPFQSVETTNKNGVKVASYGALNQPKTSLEFANETAARALEYYDEKFGHKYPLAKLDQVALPDFEAGAMENWGLVTYRESMMLAEPTAAISTKASVAVTVTHELSHQWFGDLVTMAWWDDLWLNESFATIMEYYCADALYPEFKVWEDYYTGDCLAALRRDSLKGVQAIHQDVNSPEEIATLFDGAIVYAKGARLVLMLIHLLGEKNFDQGLKDYFKKHQYQNTVGDDLWQALQPYADFNVKEFMHAWIFQPGYPMLQGKTQKRFLQDGTTDDSKWPLPEIFDDMSGHYLLNLTDQEFSQKLDQVNSLSIEQKLRLLIDRSLLARTPAVKSDSLLDLIPHFADEISGAVLEILGTVLGDLKLFCPPNTEAGKNLRTFTHQTFQDAFTRLELGDLKGDSNAIRHRDIILGFALFTRDPEVTAQLAKLYQDDYLKIDSELRSNVLLAKLRSDEKKYFPIYLEAYKKTADPELKATLLAILSNHSEQPAHHKELINLLKQPDIVRPQDHLFLFIYLLRNHYTHQTTLNWLFNNWDYIKKLTGDKSIEDYARYAATTIRTDDEAQQYFAFFDPKSNIPVLTRTIEIAHTEIAARLRLIADDSAAVSAKLTKLIS